MKDTSSEDGDGEGSGDDEDVKGRHIDTNVTVVPDDVNDIEQPSPVMKEDTHDRIRFLEKEIQRHNHLYFIEDSPEISDYEFDALVEELRVLEPESPVLDAVGAIEGSDGPGSGVDIQGEREGIGQGSDHSSPERYGDKIRHARPMLSLDKVYEIEGLIEWLDKTARDALELRERSGADPYPEGVRFLVTPKIDGVACSLTYGKDGRLILGATRGNGVIGENVTDNIRHVAAVPQSVPEEMISGDVMEVRGEMYMSHSTFSRFKDRFSNPRNLTSGALHQKVPSKTGEYGLDFYAYDARGVESVSLRAMFDMLTATGFSVPETRTLDHHPDSETREEGIQALVEGYVEARDHFPCFIDGVVLRLDDLDLFTRLGSTIHHPRGAMAYKFTAEAGTTTLLDIEWAISRHGIITPVGLIEPITLAGASLSRASLHNLGILETMDLRRGATIRVIRAGDVIPKIEAVIEPGNEPFLPPAQCPSCSGPTVREDDFLHCRNPACPGQRVHTLAHFARTVEFEGFGPKIVESLVQTGRLSTPADFYTLDMVDLQKVDRMGIKSARNLVAAVKAKRRLNLDRFLLALNIQGLGVHASRTLARQFHSLEGVLGASEEDLTGVHTFGAVTAALVIEGLEASRDIIEGLNEHVEVIHFTESADLPYRDRSFVFTGKMRVLKRDEAKRSVLELGGHTPSTVSRNLDFLVVGDEGSPLLGDGRKSKKQKTAEELNTEGATIEIISETRFLEMTETARKDVASSSATQASSASSRDGGQTSLFDF